ncbi:hypothetical protein ACWDX6_11075 [Streptomyces sp. NPDC003027]
MSEDQGNESRTTEDGPTAVVEEPQGRKRGRGRTLLTVVLPAVLVLGAAGGGIAYTAVTVQGADRSAPTVAWGPTAEPGKDPAAGVVRGRATTPLSKLLLPVPEGFRLGPDIESYGNDSEIGPKEATALLKQEARGLTGKKRREYEKKIDRLGVQGVAMRSFTSDNDDLVVNVEIVRMKDKKRIRDLFGVKRELFELLEFPEGPKIKDHKKSFCFAWPKGEKDKRSDLDGMVCSAYDSELSVTVTAEGSRPFDKSAVAALVKKQLDHIESPGEYV